METKELEKDIIILVLRLMGENPNTFSPEVAEVMERWEPKAREILLRVEVRNGLS